MDCSFTAANNLKSGSVVQKAECQAGDRNNATIISIFQLAMRYCVHKKET